MAISNYRKAGSNQGGDGQAELACTNHANSRSGHELLLLLLLMHSAMRALLLSYAQLGPKINNPGYL